MLARSPSARVARRWSSVGLVVALTVTLVPGAVALPASDEVRRDLEGAQEQLDAIDLRLSQAVEDYNEAQVGLEVAAAELDATQRELTALHDEQQALTEVVQDHLRRLYKLGPAIELSTMVMVGDPTDAGVKSWTLRRILDEQRTDLETLDATTARVGATEERAYEQQQEAELRAARHEEARADVEAAFAAAEGEVRELNVLLRRSVAEEERLAEEARLREAAEAAAREAAAREAARTASRQAAARQAAASPAPPTRNAAPEPSQPAPAPAAPAPKPAPSTRQSADVAVQTAVAQLGKPYRWGGSGPNNFDCSGLTSFAWRAAGVTIPRTSRTQFSGTKRVTRDQLQPGDLIFYHSPISHVAMYIGDGKVVEAPNSGNNVRIRNDGLTRRGIVGYGRP